jgi:surface-anchored protein
MQMNQLITAIASPQYEVRATPPMAPSPMRSWHPATSRFRAILAAILAVAIQPMLPGASLPVLVDGHTDVGINYEDDAWDLHVHAEDTGMEYAPDAVWIKVPSSARTSAPDGAAYSFLGAPGNALWVLSAVQHPNMPFLGFGTEEMASGIFSNNVVQLAFKGVEGPGDFIVYQSDMFGKPVVWFNSRDGLDASDVQQLAAGGHTHVNWVFTAPGKYHVKFQASGVLAATGQTTTSEIAEYLFDVGDQPLLALNRETGHDHLHLEWLSETNTHYQIQQRANTDSGSWTNLGSPIAGTGGTIDEHIEPSQASQFFRVLVDYSGGNQLANGDLIKLDARTAKVAATRQGLIAPSANHGNHGQFHPGIAMGLGRIYVTDPVGQQVLELDLATLSTLRTFPLAGTPTKVSMHGVLQPPTRP